MKWYSCDKEHPPLDQNESYLSVPVVVTFDGEAIAAATVRYCYRNLLWYEDALSNGGELIRIDTPLYWTYNRITILENDGVVNK